MHKEFLKMNKLILKTQGKFRSEKHNGLKINWLNFKY